MFTTGHFIWLIIISLCIITSLILLKKYKVSPAFVGKIAMIIAILGKLYHLTLSMKDTGDGGMVINQTQLDFHLCSIQVYLLIACHLIKDENKVNVIKGFMAPTMAIGALMALLTPTEGVNPNTPRVWQYMIVHANLVFYGFYLMLVEKIDLSFKVYIRNLIAFAGFAMLGMMMNSILEIYNTNFLFLRKPPMDNLPVLNLNNGYFVYLISLIAVAVGLLTIVHIPFMTKKLKTLN
ncbi:MAG: YwaF family protein [Acholeplasmatales bacterium]|nr:YwaF family protein [Acholeplasmatales bacterium]